VAITSAGTASWQAPAVSAVNAHVSAINPVESGLQGGVGPHGNEEIVEYGGADKLRIGFPVSK